MICLDIGCGRDKREGYIGIDRYLGGDVIASMDRLPFANDSVDEIYSSHALEHMPKNMIIPILREWSRVIKPHCVMQIRVPDLVWCCTKWLQHQTNDWWMDIIFGNQEHEGEFHKTGFTFQILERYLNDAGWMIGSRYYVDSHNQQTMVVLARRMP